MTAYIRCSSIHCLTQSAEFICDIPVCGEHAQALRDTIQPPLPEVASQVYYVTWRDNELVKIGVTQNISKRLTQLGTTRSRAILMATEPGGYYLERKRHRQFAHLRVQGTELFRFVPQLSEHIASLR